jgi:hypothetical protein
MKPTLELWSRVEKTNPNYTKNANVRGNKITSISPQFQIMNVTEEFGTYGETWGFKSLDFDYSLSKEFGLVVLNAKFFFPKGEFEIKNSISLFIDNAKTKVDNDFAKKIETDTLTKAISKLGFNADIFLGKFDDIRYVEEMKKEFTVVVPKVIPVLTDAVIDSVIAKGIDTIKSCLESIKKGERIATQVQILKLENASKPKQVYIQQPDPYANQEIS